MNDEVNELGTMPIDEESIAQPAESPLQFAEPAGCSLSLGVIGNCAFSALVDQRARIVLRQRAGEVDQSAGLDGRAVRPDGCGPHVHDLL